ncbi:MAG: CBS domain-containing protein [Chloroflexota bacterium]
MKTIRQILKQKGRQIWSTAPDAHVFDALKLMAEKDVGALLVMDGEKVVGVFSERDYSRKIILKGKTSQTTLVHEIMSSPVVFIPADQTCEEGLALMTARHIRHLPVFDGRKLIGVVSIGDLVKAVMQTQKQVIDKLEKYILDNMSLT